MGCEEVRLLLDAFIDGELSADQESALMEHVNACEACRSEFDAAVLLRDTLKDMDEDVAVPLEAQAAWRRAVCEEAARKKMRRWTRAIGVAAAALALVVGCSFALRGDLFADELPATVPEVSVASATNEDAGAGVMALSARSALVAADGETEETAGAGESWSAKKKFASADFDSACETIAQLCAEYSGSCSFEMNSEAGGPRKALCRIELPADYMQDFLNAASLLGTELDSETMQTSGETAVVYIQIDETL